MRRVALGCAVLGLQGCLLVASGPPPAPAGAVGPVADVGGGVGEVKVAWKTIPLIPEVTGAWLLELPGDDIVLDVRGDVSLAHTALTPGLWFRFPARRAIRLGGAVGTGDLWGLFAFAQGFGGGSIHLQQGWGKKGNEHAITLGGGGAAPWTSHNYATLFLISEAYPTAWGSVDGSWSWRTGKSSRLVLDAGAYIWYPATGSQGFDLSTLILPRLALGMRFGKSEAPKVP